MIAHPLGLAVLALDALALLFALVSARTGLRVLLGWNPDASDGRQLNLEADRANASLAGRAALYAALVAGALWIADIALALPGVVSGAMCGTGVLQAMDGLGERALMLRALGLAALWVAVTVDRVDAALPRAPLTLMASRWHLLAAPLVALSAWSTLRASLALDPARPVDCCQMVYGDFGSLAQATTAHGIAESTWLILAVAGAALLAGLLSWRLWATRGGAGSFAGHRLLGALVLAWLPLAGIALVRVLSAYHYGVLHHHCPWCLFSPQHGAVGLPLFGALLLLGLEALALWTSGALTRLEPSALAAAAARQRRALWSMALALGVFVLLAGGPALLWRLRHGVWMHGV